MALIASRPPQVAQSLNGKEKPYALSLMLYSGLVGSLLQILPNITCTLLVMVRMAFCVIVSPVCGAMDLYVD